MFEKSVKKFTRQQQSFSNYECLTSEICAVKLSNAHVS